MARKKIISVSIHDCEVQHFRSGGKGGQNQNKRDTGTRVIHHPSGARGEARDERSQWQNKKSAFLRMINSPKFQLWLKLETGRVVADTENHLSEERHPFDEDDLLIEVRENGRWVTA